MQNIKFKIIGRRVHDVGYRVLLVDKALSLGVDNFNTFNTYLDGVQGVIVVIEANDEAIEELKNFVVSVRPEKSIVYDVSFEEYKNSVPPVERVMQSFQMEISDIKERLSNVESAVSIV
jgi:acylphosphatase